MNERYTRGGRPFRFCTYCGAPVVPDAAFCTRCGRRYEFAARSQGASRAHSAPPVRGTQPVPVAVMRRTAAAPPIRRPKKRMSKGLAVALSALGVTALIWVALLIVFRDKPVMQLGTPTLAAHEEIGPGGGELTVHNAQSAIDGLTITVPDGAYASAMDYTFETQEIKSHGFGRDFNPVTPLITIDNGHVFADEPMTVTVPIDKSDDEFVMGFFYDELTGTLEGIPFAEETNDHITVTTQHFSHIVFSKIKKGRILDKLDTGFMPGRDDFSTVNWGSYAVPGGNCGGQVIAMAYYYKNTGRAGWGGTVAGTLFTRFDNNGRGFTPEFWEDDSRIVRLSGAIQHALKGVWRSKADADVEYYKNYVGTDDELTYYAFAYAMQLTGQPQFLYLTKKSVGAHAVLAYRIDGNKIYVADPNWPGEKGLYVELQRTAGSKPRFVPYSSSLTAGTSGISFDRVGYFGAYALVDESMVFGYWQQVLSGKPVAPGLYPADSEILVSMNVDGSGNKIAELLTDGIALAPSDTPEAEDNRSPTDINLMLAGEVSGDDRYTVYVGQEAVFKLSDEKWSAALTLDYGDNDIGILHERQVTYRQSTFYTYVDFTRCNIVCTEGAILPSASSAPAEEEEKIAPNSVVTGRWDYIGEAVREPGETEYHDFESVDNDYGMYLEFTEAGMMYDKYGEAYPYYVKYGDEYSEYTVVPKGSEWPNWSIPFYFVGYDGNLYIVHYLSGIGSDSYEVYRKVD